MKLTKQHQLYLGILGVAVLGLVADKTLFGPSDAVAESADEYSVDDADDSSTAVISISQSATPSIATRLVGIKDRQNVDPANARDVFMRDWLLPDPTPLHEPSTAEPARPRFDQTHKISAVMGSGANGFVIVNETLVRVGQSIGGMKLIAVNDRSAFFEDSSGRRVELKVEIKGRSPSNAPASAGETPVISPGDSKSPSD